MKWDEACTQWVLSLATITIIAGFWGRRPGWLSSPMSTHTPTLPPPPDGGAPSLGLHTSPERKLYKQLAQLRTALGGREILVLSPHAPPWHFSQWRLGLPWHSGIISPSPWWCLRGRTHSLTHSYSHLWPTPSAFPRAHGWSHQTTWSPASLWMPPSFFLAIPQGM